MDITAREKGAATGSPNAPAEGVASHAGGERVLDRGELIDRLAQQMRLKSGIDLPHAYFVEQVKLQLSGSPAFDQSLADNDDPAAKRAASYQSAACFEAWAMRD